MDKKNFEPKIERKILFDSKISILAQNGFWIQKSNQNIFRYKNCQKLIFDPKISILGQNRFSIQKWPNFFLILINIKI